jgi:hypothetical protein
MSSASFASSGGGTWLGGESSNRVWLARLDAALQPAAPVVWPAGEGARKHPSVAVAPDGAVLLAWIEGSGWARGGKLGWQLFDRDGRPLAKAEHGPDLPAWSFPCAVARRDGSFLLLH